MKIGRAGSASAIAVAMCLSAAAAQAQECKVTIGSVMSLTGAAGQFGQAASKSIELAFRDVNAAGGIMGCTIRAEFRDAQTQGSVAADAARQLVDINGVPVIIGGIISSVSMPILTSVTAPAGVVQVSPASSSPSFTALAEDGKTGGFWFRTITSDALQGVAAAQYAMDSGLENLAIIHVNNDFGVNMVREFTRAYEALGGTITSITPYNQNQSSYASEVTAALSGVPQALYLVGYPGDGTTVAQTWISQGGPQTFLLNDGMNSADFITDVGSSYLNNAFGTSSGTVQTPSTEYFAAEYGNFSDFDWQSPAADRSYDAAAIVALAIAHAGSAEPAAIRDSIRAVLDPQGEPIYAGAEQFQKAFEFIGRGAPIRYVGVIGPVGFDALGDIAGPFRLWRIQDGEVVTVGEMTTDDIDAIKTAIAN